MASVIWWVGSLRSNSCGIHICEIIPYFIFCLEVPSWWILWGNLHQLMWSFTVFAAQYNQDCLTLFLFSLIRGTFAKSPFFGQLGSIFSQGIMFPVLIDAVEAWLRCWRWACYQQTKSRETIVASWFYLDHICCFIIIALLPWGWWFLARNVYTTIRGYVF